MQWRGMRPLARRNVVPFTIPLANLPASTSFQQRHRPVPSSILRAPCGVPLRKAREEASADDVDALPPAVPARLADNPRSTSVIASTIAATGLITPILVSIIGAPTPIATTGVIVPKHIPTIGAPISTIRAPTMVIISARATSVIITTWVIHIAIGTVTAMTHPGATVIAAMGIASSASRGGCPLPSSSVANGVGVSGVGPASGGVGG